MKCVKDTMSMFLAIIMLMSIAFPVCAEGLREAPPEILEGEGMTHKYLIYGSYEQDNNLENGPEPIEWLVLKEEDGRALVISRYALELRRYHHSISEDDSVTWETWDLRAWLNGEFLETAFTETERERIPTVTVEARGTNIFPTDPGNNTEDKIFLLSYQEASRYFKGGRARKCQPTAHAIANYEIANGKEWKVIGYRKSDSGNCSWWLRTPGEFPGSGSLVGSDGVMGFIGRVSVAMMHLHDYNYGVRPAMWIDLEP